MMAAMREISEHDWDRDPNAVTDYAGLVEYTTQWRGDDLVSFLRARLDEDELAAKQLIGNIVMSALLRIFAEGSPVLIDLGHRQLREVAAKRAILELHNVRRIGTWPVCTHCRPVDPEFVDDLTSEPWPCRTLRHLAAVYSDHPGYQQEWKP